MAVGVENTAHNDNTTLGGATSATVAGFTITNANALCVTISFLALTPPTSVTATWDSGGTNQAMTQVVHTTSTGLDAYIFGLLAPTTGAHTLSVTWVNAADFGIGVVGLTGVSQTSVATSFINPTTNTGTGTTASVTIPTSANGGVIGIAVDNDPTSSASAVSNTVLLLGNGVIINNAGDFVSNYQVTSGSTSVTLSYTLGSANWAYAGINISAAVALGWGFEQSNQFQSPYSTVRNTHRASGVKGKSGFAVSPIPFKEGWQVQPPQPPFRPQIRQRSAALSHPEEGVEGKFSGFKQSGWEIQPPQPPKNPKTKQLGAILRGIDGIEARFIRTATRGWEIQPFQPSFYPTVSQRAPGIKFKSEFAIYATSINYGWEIQSVQPPANPTTKQKIGALSQWEDGIEAVYVFVAPTQIRWGYDFQQPPLKINYRSSAWSQKTEGIEEPFVNFLPSGWEIQPPPPPHTFVEKRGAILRGDDGAEGTLINFFPLGFEVQPVQPPVNPTIKQKIGGLSQWEDGTEFPFIFVSPTQIRWGYDTQPTTLTQRFYQSGKGVPNSGDDGIGSPYNNFLSYGWEIQSVQPPTFPKINQRYDALSHPEEGIESKFFQNVFLNWGFELQSGWQPPTFPKTSQKIGATSQWEDGTEGLYVFVAPPQPIWSWDIQSFQPISIPTNQQKYSGIKSKSGFAAFQPWVNGGWEIQSWQPPTYPTTQQKLGALSHPEEGIEAKYIFVAPAQPIWGYDIQPTISKINYRSGAWSQGEKGIDLPFIGFVPYGWEIQPPQPPAAPKTNTRVGALSQWEDGIEAKFIFVAPATIKWAFDFQQTPLKINYRSGAWSQWEDGIEGVYVFVAPNQTLSGWEIQSFQPSFYPTINQRGPAIKGKAEFAIYPKQISAGWEIQSTQPPYFIKNNQKYGALSHPEEGIEAKYIFVAQSIITWGWESSLHLKQQVSNRYSGIEGTSEFASFTFRPYGWEIQPYQPINYLRTNQKLGALSRCEDGIEAPFIFVPPTTPLEFLDFQQPPLKINYRSGSWSQWEDGIELPFINFLSYGWEIQPPQPSSYPATKQKIGALSQWEDGIEAKFIFVAPATLKWAFDFQQPPLKINYRSAAWSQGEKGIDLSFLSFVPYGWEVQPVQPPAFPKINVKYGALSHPEEGIEAKYVFVAPPPLIWAFDFQQPPLKINYRSGSWSQKTEGIEAKLINFFPSGWEIQPYQPPNFLKTNLKIGALSHPEEGIEGLFIPPFIAPVAHQWGFEFQTPWQPPNFPRVNQRGPAIKGKSEYAIYSNWVNGGWEIQPYQPPFSPKTSQKYGASSQPSGGIEGKFIFVAPPQLKWGWEFASHLRHLTTNRYPAIEGTSEFASFSYQPLGWEIQPVQPPNSLRPNQRQGALSQYEDGSESKFIFVAPPQIRWGYDIQPTISKVYYRSGSWSQWEDGIEFPFINPFKNGWEIQSVQPPHPKPEVKAASILRGIDGIEAQLTRFFPAGWEIQPPQPPNFPTLGRKYGALSHPEEGIEAKFIFVAPPFFTDAWEFQPLQSRYVFEKKGAILRGIDGIEAQFNRFFPSGWEIQPPQPPFFLKTSRKIGATSQWEDGIEAVYVFVAPPQLPEGWDPSLPLLPYWLRLYQKGWGVLSQWEDGIEGIYVFVPPIPPIPPVPPPGPISGLRFQDMQVLGIAPTSTLYWDYSSTERFYVFQNNTLYRVSPRYAFNWYATTPGATTVYNPFLSSILSGSLLHLSDDPN